MASTLEETHRCRRARARHLPRSRADPFPLAPGAARGIRDDRGRAGAPERAVPRRAHALRGRARRDDQRVLVRRRRERGRADGGQAEHRLAAAAAVGLAEVPSRQRLGDEGRARHRPRAARLRRAGGARQRGAARAQPAHHDPARHDVGLPPAEPRRRARREIAGGAQGRRRRRGRAISPRCTATTASPPTATRSSSTSPAWRSASACWPGCTSSPTACCKGEGIEERTIIGCLVAGALGAVVSVIARINSGTFDLDFDVARGYTLFLGALRPVIGSIFGLLAYFMLTSGFVDVFQLPDDEHRALLLPLRDRLRRGLQRALGAGHADRRADRSRPRQGRAAAPRQAGKPAPHARPAAAGADADFARLSCACAPWLGAVAAQAVAAAVVAARFARGRRRRAPLAAGAPRPAATVSIVIPARDEEDRLGPCLQALRDVRRRAARRRRLLDGRHGAARALARGARAGGRRAAVGLDRQGVGAAAGPRGRERRMGRLPRRRHAPAARPDRRADRGRAAVRPADRGAALRLHGRRRAAAASGDGGDDPLPGRTAGRRRLAAAAAPRDRQRAVRRGAPRAVSGGGRLGSRARPSHLRGHRAGALAAGGAAGSWASSMRRTCSRCGCTSPRARRGRAGGAR